MINYFNRALIAVLTQTLCCLCCSVSSITHPILWAQGAMLMPYDLQRPNFA